MALHYLGATRSSLLGYLIPHGLLHGREDLLLQLMPVAVLVDPFIFWQDLGPKMLIYV